MRANTIEQVGIAHIIRTFVVVIALLVVAASHEGRTGDVLAIRLATVVVDERGTRAIVTGRAADTDIVLVHEAVAVRVVGTGNRLPVRVLEHRGHLGAELLNGRGRRVDGFGFVGTAKAGQRQEQTEQRPEPVLCHRATPST